MFLYKFMGNLTHINHQKTQAFTLCFIITVFLVTQSAAQQLQYGSIKRSVYLPVEIANGIPYLNLKNLCEVEVKQQMIGGQQINWPTPKQSQFQQMSNFYQLTDVIVLLDTGSSEFWLADNSCYKCSYTKNFCPHLQTSEKKSSYVKGYIQGIDSYINLCPNRIKFMCVRKMEGLGQINGHGILGLTHQATGFSMLYNILSKRPSNKIHLQQNKNKQASKKRGLVHKFIRQTFYLQFIFGQYKSYFYLSHTKAIETYSSKHEGMTTNKKKSGLEVKCQKDWSFDVEEISFFRQAIKIRISPQKIKKIRVNVDTGSSKLVLSNNLCGILIGEAQERLGLRCRYVEGKGIDCNKIVNDFHFTVKVKEERVISDKNSKEKSILKIRDYFLIEPASNRLQILCQQSQQSLGLILLGHSFLQSSHTTFSVQTFKQISQQEETIEAVQYSIRIEPRQFGEIGEDRILKLMIIFYVLTVGLIAWGTMATLDFLRDKRSTKIII